MKTITQDDKIQKNLPGVSVVIRSYNRLDSCIELIEGVLEQEYPNFEVIVVEQSTEYSNKQKTTLSELTDNHSNLKIFYSPPLGPSGARNSGWRSASKEIVLFMDDDDLPLGNDWILKHALNYEDKNIVGVSGREVLVPDEKCGYKNRRRALSRCLSYNFFGYPQVYCRLDEGVDPVEWLHGGNASIRRSTIEAVGGWDEYFQDHEEHSFALALASKLSAGQRLIFNPSPVILRRKNITGGLDRRFQSTGLIYQNTFVYLHRLVSKYFPFRFIALYPLYLILMTFVTVRWIWKDSHQHKTFGTRLLGSIIAIVSSPIWWISAWLTLIFSGKQKIEE